MDWTEYMNEVGIIDVLQALRVRHEHFPLDNYEIGAQIITAITSLTPIKSPEIATTILVLAVYGSNIKTLVESAK